MKKNLGKTREKTHSGKGNSSLLKLKINQGNPNNQGKEGKTKHSLKTQTFAENRRFSQEPAEFGGTLPQPDMVCLAHRNRSDPRGPKDQKKKFEISIEIENFDREWNFRASHPPRPYFLLWGNRDVEIKIFERDQTFRSRLKISIEIKFFVIVGPSGIFAICDCDAPREPQKSQRFPRQEKAMLHCDLRVRWKVASDLRFRAAMSEPKTPSFCRFSSGTRRIWRNTSPARHGLSLGDRRAVS